MQSPAASRVARLPGARRHAPIAWRRPREARVTGLARASRSCVACGGVMQAEPAVNGKGKEGRVAVRRAASPLGDSRGEARSGAPGRRFTILLRRPAREALIPRVSFVQWVLVFLAEAAKLLLEVLLPVVFRLLADVISHRQDMHGADAEFAVTSLPGEVTIQRVLLFEPTGGDTFQAFDDAGRRDFWTARTGCECDHARN